MQYIKLLANLENIVKLISISIVSSVSAYWLIRTLYFYLLTYLITYKLLVLKKLVQLLTKSFAIPHVTVFRFPRA